MRVLLVRWLLKRGRIAIGELGRQTGLSHPTARRGLAALGDAVERKPDRSAILRSLPQEQWSKLLALAPRVRQTVSFVDPSGRGADPQRLLLRLDQSRPRGVAIGGVIAARSDLSVHAPSGKSDTDFVEDLDPALVPAPSGSPPLLVLHAVPRAESLFAVGDDGGLPVADPVEVLLDLHEMRLGEQADQLFAALRGAS